MPPSAPDSIVGCGWLIPSGEPAMKLAVFEIEEWEREAFERLAQGQDIRFLSEPLTAENADLYSDADIISTFIYSELGHDTLSRFRNLRFIATRSTGYDHIDTAYCAGHGIRVGRVPGSCAHC